MAGVLLRRNPCLTGEIEDLKSDNCLKFSHLLVERHCFKGREVTNRRVGPMDSRTYYGDRSRDFGASLALVATDVECEVPEKY